MVGNTTSRCVLLVFGICALVFRSGQLEAGVAYLDPVGGWDYEYHVDAGDDAFGSATPGAFDGLDGSWNHEPLDTWDRSAAGDPLGEPPENPAPGGVGILTDGSASFLRLQDTGDPSSLWPETDNLTGDSSNRRLYFAHDIAGDAVSLPSNRVMDDGITITARLRLATAATGPVDDSYTEAGVKPWPAGGHGSTVSNDAQGMFGLEQNTGALDPGQSLGFALALESQTPEGIGGGLVMNNFLPEGSPDVLVQTEFATLETINLVPLSDASMTQWHEFWITVHEVAPDDNHWTVNVYSDGATDSSEFEAGKRGTTAFIRDGLGLANLVMGLSLDQEYGAFDLDFFNYKLGVHAPRSSAMGDADYNDDGVVNAADYTVWRDSLGESGPDLPADGNGDLTVDDLDYDFWKMDFGSTVGGLTQNAVPEPSTSLLAIVVGAGMLMFRSHFGSYEGTA